MFLFNGLGSLMGGHPAGNALGNAFGNGNGLLDGNQSGQPAVEENLTQNFFDKDDSAGLDRLASDAGRDHVLDSDSGGFDDGGGFMDDDFA